MTIDGGAPCADVLQEESAGAIAPNAAVLADHHILHNDGFPDIRVVLDTHSVNLNGYRFEEVVRLRDGKGSELAPTAVENPQGGGHHRSATVRFAWPEPRPKSLELVVKGVAGVPERLFRWTLE